MTHPPFVDAAARRTRPRRAWTDWRLVALGVSMVVAATTVGVVQLSSAFESRQIQVSSSGRPPSDSVTGVLERAVDTMENTPGKEPRADQWIYVKDVHGTTRQSGTTRNDRFINERWTRYGGFQTASIEPPPPMEGASSG